VDLPWCLADLQRLTQEVFLPALGSSHYALMGHSFGGLLAIAWALSNPPQLTRLVVESPLLEVGFPIPWWKAAIGAALSVLWPTCPLSADLDLSALSHDPAVVKAYREDPLVHGTITAATYRATIRLRDHVMRKAAQLKVPTLLLTAGTDRIVSVEAERQWFARLTCEKRHREFPDSFHELHHESVRGEVFQFIREWVLPRA
jgi:alpha-beta hydrolase superfamily lysophospholipase